MKRLFFAFILLSALCLGSCRAGDCGCPMSNVEYPISDAELPRLA